MGACPGLTSAGRSVRNTRLTVSQVHWKFRPCHEALCGRRARAARQRTKHVQIQIQIQIQYTEHNYSRAATTPSSHVRGRAHFSTAGLLHRKRTHSAGSRSRHPRAGDWVDERPWQRGRVDELQGRQLREQPHAELVVLPVPHACAAAPPRARASAATARTDNANAPRRDCEYMCTAVLGAGCSNPPATYSDRRMPANASACRHA